MVNNTQWEILRWLEITFELKQGRIHSNPVADGWAGAVLQKTAQNSTRPDTRPTVADGWAGAEMRVFPLFDSMVTDRRTDGPTDGWTDGRTDPLIES